MRGIEIEKETTSLDIPLKDIEFDPYRSALTDRLKTQIEEVRLQVRDYESYFQTRRRKRKPQDEEIFRETISALICDLIYRYLRNPEQKVYLQLSNRHLGVKSRYRPRALSKTLPSILRILSSPELGFIRMKIGVLREQWPGEERVSSRATTIWPDSKLIREIQTSGITFADFGRKPDQEVIELRQTKQSGSKRGRLVSYADTDVTNRYRAEVKTINHWLGCADIECDAPGRDIDSRNRHLHRIFNNNSFEQGGRLFGGFWLPMNKEWRSDIRVDNNPIVVLDYAQMFLRLCYGVVGREPPLGDLYDIPALTGRGAARNGIKKVINAFFFSDKRLSRLPKGVRRYFPQSLRCEDILAAVEEYHKSVAHLLFANMGMRLMFLESKILVTNLLTLIDKGITALPIHDALLVSHRDKDIARQVMLDSFKSIGGVEGKVTLKET